MPLFEAQFVIHEENIWFAEIEPYHAVQRQENVILKTALLIADDAEAAYEQAFAMIDNLSEANFDGPGDITNLACQGISQLREIPVEDIAEGNDGNPQEIAYSTSTNDGATAIVREKMELDVFCKAGKTL